MEEMEEGEPWGCSKIVAFEVSAIGLVERSEVEVGVELNCRVVATVLLHAQGFIYHWNQVRELPLVGFMEVSIEEVSHFKDKHSVEEDAVVSHPEHLQDELRQRRAK